MILLLFSGSAPIEVGCELRWDTLVTAERSVALSWDVYEVVASPISISWDLGTNVYSGVSLLWVTSGVARQIVGESAYICRVSPETAYVTQVVTDTSFC